jgi:hypothetical protein
MAYNPINFQNREVERPRTFVITNNPDGTITLTPSEGQVLVGGTPLDANNLNKMDQQIAVNDSRLTALEKNPVYASMSKTTNQYIYGGQYTKITFNNTLANQDSILSVAGSTDFTVKQSGFYLFTVSVGYTGIVNTSGAISISLTKGGVDYFLNGAHYTQTGNITLTGSQILELNTNETFAFTAYCSANANLVGQSPNLRTYFQMLKVGEL